MHVPRGWLLLLVLLLSVCFSLSGARSYRLSPEEPEEEPDDIDLESEGDEPSEETEDPRMDEEETEEDGIEEDGVEDDGSDEENMEERMGEKTHGRAQGRLTVQRGETILRAERHAIRQFEIHIQLGRQFEQNLTSMRELVATEMEKSRTRREMVDCQKKMAKIDKILTQVKTRTDESEMRFRKLLKRILSGDIRSERRCHTLLQGLLSGYRTSLQSVVRNSAGFLRSIARGVSGALAHLGRGILDVFKLKFEPFKLAIDAITNRRRFRRPFGSMVFGR
ncbi:uncharacterized protein LOC119431616 [Dermacentor silvarum]|uniref:uncharacterized protein LOC119431616 n=1 Tax=Dermacentor silvarum TaxID=543639 RepID=UPI0018975B7F|nr:uncharacterized protein LOC119431616 [Dermacentor silvarum]